MTKYKVLGVVNILLSIFFIFNLVTSSFSKEPLISIESFIHAYAPNGILLFSLTMNAFLAYKLLIKKDNKLPSYLYLILTFSTVFWFLLLFVGYFFASNVIFPIVSLVLMVSIFYFLRKPSKKIAVILSLVTLLVSVVVIISSFEEDYCFKKGTQADSTGLKRVIAKKEDVMVLKDFDVNEGTQIGVSFQTHMLCHDTFNFMDAIKEKYSFTK